MKYPQVRLAQYFPFLAIRTDLNSSRIRESVQVQTAQEHSGPEFQDPPSFFPGAVEKAISFQAETIVQLRTSREGRERNTANSASK